MRRGFGGGSSNFAQIAQNSSENSQNLSFNTYKLAPKPRLISDEAGALSISTNEDLSAFDRARNLALQNCKSLSAPLEIIIPGKLYKCEDAYYALECDNEVQAALAATSDESIVLDTYADLDLEAFLNLNATFKERVIVVY